MYKDVYTLFTDKKAGQLYSTFVFYRVVSTVGYVCSFLRDQIFVDFVSFKFLSMIIYEVLYTLS